MININNNKYTKLSKQEYKQYSKQLILENIGIEGQEKIKQSKVLVVGLGGLGNIITTYLAISGVGLIGLIDGDNIEHSNLNRQILYNKDDIKKFKVITAKKN